MFKVKITHNIPESPVGWPQRYAEYFDLARHDTEGGEVYISVYRQGNLVAMAQIIFDTFYNDYDLKILVSAFPNGGSMALGRALAYATHDGHRLHIFASNKTAAGFYTHLRVISRKPGAGDRFIAEAIK